MADSTLRLEVATLPWDAAGPASEEIELVEGLRRGDERSYEILLARFQHPVHNLVYRLLANPEDTADVVQEVFLKVFRSIGSFRGRSSLKTWIYRIAVNEAYNHRRWFGRRGRCEVGLEEDLGEGRTLEQTLADHGRSPLEVALDHEAQASIEAALQRIKPVFRQTVVLRDVEGLSYEEIAEILQVSLGTVKSRILRGREALRELLTEGRKPDSGWSWAPQGVDLS